MGDSKSLQSFKAEREMNSILTAALKYESMGFSVIPVQESKKPYIAWEKYQTERANPELIKEWWQKYTTANVAIVTGKVSKLGVVDCDSPEGREALEELLPDNLITPIATTPGGGWHYYFDHRNGLGNAARFLQDTDFRGQGGYIISPPSSGYAWMPGLNIEKTIPAELPTSIDKYLSLYREGVDIPGTPQSNKSISFEQGQRDETLFHLANCLVKGGMADDNTLKCLNFFASHCNPPYPKKEIPAKIESAIKRFSTRERVLADEVREYVLSTDGHVLSTDVYNSLDVSTRKEKKNVSEILSRLMKEGLIERAGRKNGCFRKLDAECDTIDWESASGIPLDIAWPLQLEKKVTIYPKSLAVIAGVQNVGKSCFALNLAYMNRNTMPVRYLSSEMGGDELHNRLNLFNQPSEEWKRVDFRERSRNFGDVILPDALNIVDYYEIDKDFWRIAGDLRIIYERLKAGIAVVCLQKSQGKDAGRGGDFGLEKPRLYLNLDPDPPRGAVLMIRKAKGWASAENPNFKKIRFRILNGSKMIKVDDWYIDE